MYLPGLKPSPFRRAAFRPLFFLPILSIPFLASIPTEKARTETASCSSPHPGLSQSLLCILRITHSSGIPERDRIGEILPSPSTPRSVPFGTARFNSLHELSDNGLTSLHVRISEMVHPPSDSVIELLLPLGIAPLVPSGCEPPSFQLLIQFV